MHKIDRYGVIALVFMAVTFLTVYFWDDHGKTQSPAGKDARGDSTRLEPRPESKPPAPDHRAAGEKRANALPLSANEPTTLHAGAREGSLRQDPANKAADPLPRPMPAELDERKPSDGTGSTQTKGSEQAGPRLTDAGGSDAGTADRAEDRRAAGRETIELASTGETIGAGAAGSQRAREEGHTPDTPASSTTRSYIVAKGDTLEGIAARELGNRQRWNEIQALNGGLDPKRLWVGKVLRLPVGKQAAEVAGTPPAERSKDTTRTTEPAANTRTYVVKKGDILGTIAQRELGSAKSLARISALNPGMDPNHLVPGMKLVLPGGTAPKTNVPLELSTGSSRKVARAEPRPEGAFKVR